MPYIDPRLRTPDLEARITLLISEMSRLATSDIGTGGEDGILNYVITRLIVRWTAYRCSKLGYAWMSRILGVLEAVKQEYYRRVVTPYEAAKARENGDVYG